MNSGSANQAQSEAAPSRPIPDAMTTLCNRQDITADTIDELENVLDKILQPVVTKVPDALSGVRAVRQEESPLHGELCARIERQGDINSRLRALIGRVTL